MKKLSSIFSLLNKPLITVTRRMTEKKDFDTNIITITNIWPENYRYFYSDERYIHKRREGTSVNGGTVPPQTEVKEDPLEEDPIIITTAADYSSIAPPPPNVRSAAAVKNNFSSKHTPLWFTDSKGKKRQVYEEDIYRHFLKSNFPTEIIAQAIEEAKITEIVNHPLNFIEAICHNAMRSKSLGKTKLEDELNKKSEEKRLKEQEYNKKVEEQIKIRKERGHNPLWWK